MRGKYLAAFALCVVATACEPPTDPIGTPQRRLVIHAVLNPSAEIQWVRVQYLDGEFGHDLQDIRDAVVTLTTPTGEVLTVDWFQTQPYFAYGFELADETQLVPGGTYTLRVRTVAGEEASGTTTVPVYPSLPTGQNIPLFQRDLDTLRLVWNAVSLAARYELVVETHVLVDGQNFGQQTWRTFSDTTIALAGTMRTLDNEPVFQPRSGVVFVSAVDDNYYTYYHLSVDPFAGAPPSRLTGALGVFGSVAPIRIVFLHEIR